MRNGFGLRLSLAALLASLVVSGAAGAAPASEPSPVRSALASWAGSHPATSALVWRLEDTGPVPIAAFRPETPLLPASTMKLVTSAGALLSLGPDFRFETRLYAGVNSFRRGRVLQGPIYILGSGDPVLATADYSRTFLGGKGSSLGKLVAPLRAQGISLVKGPVVADESLFDDQRTGPRWKSSYASECSPLSALAVNQNFAGKWQSGYITNPPVAAAQRLKQTMAALGVRHKGRVREGNAPDEGRLLSTVQSPPLRVIVGLMNRNSDNFIAEMLSKDVGAHSAGQGSTVAGTEHTAGLLGDMGVLGAGDRLVDGSGLSRSNRLAAGTLVRLLAAASADSTWGTPLIDSLPDRLPRSWKDRVHQRRVKFGRGGREPCGCALRLCVHHEPLGHHRRESHPGPRGDAACARRRRQPRSSAELIRPACPRPGRSRRPGPGPRAASTPRRDTPR
jgi:serine-type D-Ala-D-Ala carboxypeptidase/endopeptidase (penicillin-binding protein 4)